MTKASEVKTSSVDDNNVVTESSDGSAAPTELGLNVLNLSLEIHVEDGCMKEESRQLSETVPEVWVAGHRQEIVPMKADLYKQTVSMEPTEAGNDREPVSEEAGHINETMSGKSSHNKVTVSGEVEKANGEMKR